MSAKARVILFVGDDRAAGAASQLSGVAKRMGLPFTAVHKSAGTATTPERESAHTVVTFETLPPAKDKPELWGGTANLEQEVMDLVARLLGGRNSADVPPPAPKPAPPKKVHTVRIARETAGRRGKGVTTVWELPLGEEAVKDLAAALKQKCGTGGTVKDGKIEIQGDHRDRITEELEKLGYKVKRSGG